MASQFRAEAIKAAKDLCYGDEVVAKIKKAKNENEVSRIMHDARHNCEDNYTKLVKRYTARAMGEEIKESDRMKRSYKKRVEKKKKEKEKSENEVSTMPLEGPKTPVEPLSDNKTEKKSRAEIRRFKREIDKANKRTYNLTEAQLQAMVAERMDGVIAEAKKEATEIAINKALVLLFALPMEVLREDFWAKTYKSKLPDFADKMIAKYLEWQDGKLDLAVLKQDLWDYAGVRLEEEVV